MLWQQMLVDYDVAHVKYFKAMWQGRRRFVPVYRAFFPFVHSTSRSEGTNSVFKDNIGSTYCVTSFMSEYQRIIEAIEEKEKEANSITRITEPTYWVKSEIEIQATRIYNRQILYRFQKYLMFTPKLHVEEIEKHVKYEVFKTRMLAEKDFRPRRYTILVNMPTEDFSCICCKFEKDGIVCSHILRVLVHLNLFELPVKYYINRWKPKDRKAFRDPQFNIPMELTSENRHLRYNKLSNKLIDIASEGSKSNEKYMVVVRESDKIEEMLENMTRAEELQAMQDKLGQNKTSFEPFQHPDGYGDDLQDPDVAKSKGRPQGWRYKTVVEQLFSKQKITCNHCDSHEHNIATCGFKHIDKSNFQANKKTRGKEIAGCSGESKQKQSGPKINLQPRNQRLQKWHCSLDRKEAKE